MALAIFVDFPTHKITSDLKVEKIFSGCPPQKRWAKSNSAAGLGAWGNSCAHCSQRPDQQLLRKLCLNDTAPTAWTELFHAVASGTDFQVCVQSSRRVFAVVRRCARVHDCARFGSCLLPARAFLYVWPFRRTCVNLHCESRHVCVPERENQLRIQFWTREHP